MSIHRPQGLALFDRAILAQAAVDAVKKLDPRQLVRNPVMFATAVVAVVATILTARGGPLVGVMIQISAWLWFTVLFANFAEAIAEGRGKAQAASLRKTKTEAVAKRVASADATAFETIPAQRLRAGDLVVCELG
ncbi:MAG TPA: potassium-transporting ATPase subunit B, partial [Magnetospirillum sp.]|nr:potassium-transporting ATPase subunit B [Magnetospirillum sp.]